MLMHETACAKARGFTLVELMVTIVIGSILLAVAIPSYQSQIRKSRRTEAKNALLDLAAREERYFTTANAYTNDPVSLGYPAGGFGATAPIGGGYYYLNVPAITAADPTTSPPTQAAYSLTATVLGTQLNDSACQSFTVTQTGQQSSIDSGGAQTTGNASQCWK